MGLAGGMPDGAQVEAGVKLKIVEDALRFVNCDMVFCHRGCGCRFRLCKPRILAAQEET